MSLYIKQRRKDLWPVKRINDAVYRIQQGSLKSKMNVDNQLLRRGQCCEWYRLTSVGECRHTVRGNTCWTLQ